MEIQQNFMNNIGIKKLYIIQGNHDLPPTKDNLRINNLILNNGHFANTIFGKIGGVNGIISHKFHPYKMNEKDYFKYMNNFIKSKPNILLTHMTPEFIYEKQKFIIMFLK
jgi:predicted MPP superfamily phosphohydrolase